MKNRIDAIRDKLLEDWQFSQTKDEINSFSTNSILYYLGLEENQYILFNHYCKIKRLSYKALIAGYVSLKALKILAKKNQLSLTK